ncbi:alpha/beta hydrolase-fold protein, partial [Bacteroidota bacterium]
VIYILDGKAHFQHATSAVNFLSSRGLIPQMIVIAVHNVDRNRDFSPIHDERIPTSGGAGKFIKFLKKELMPMVDEKYQTSGFTILMGHSFGGTFATYSLLTLPELFDGYIAISPYIHFMDSYLVEEAATKLKSEYDSQKFFYMTVGDEPPYFEPLGKFSSLLKEKSGESIVFKYVKMEDEDHGSIPYISLFSGLRFVFSDWQLPAEAITGGLKTVDQHYQFISEKYGNKVETPELVINQLGYYYLQIEDVDAAIKVFTENVQRYPKSSNVYDSLGEAYENNNQLDLARENYKKAVELGMEQKHPNTEVYKKNLRRVSETVDRGENSFAEYAWLLNYVAIMQVIN